MSNQSALKRRKTEGSHSQNASTRKEMVRRDKLSDEQFQKDKIRRNTNSTVFQARKKLKQTAAFARHSSMSRRHFMGLLYRTSSLPLARAP